MKLFFNLLCCVFLTGCTLGNINSLYRSPTLKYGSSHIVDAKQRFVLTYPGLVKLNGAGEVIPTQSISCAEPSPDVFSVFAASAEASVSKGGASGAGSFATSETGASLVERTTALQALRDAYFRLCEAYGNGMIDEIDFMVGQRHNQTALMGLLAIEEMNALAKRPTVVIGSDASATSASAVQAAASTMNRLLDENRERTEKIEANNSQIGALQESIVELEKVKDDPATAEVNEAEVAQKEAEKKKSEKATLENQNKELKSKNETNTKLVDAIVESIKSGGATGSAARSVIQQQAQQINSCKDGCDTQRQEIAKQMVEVVRQVDDNDFGPTICLSYLRKSSPGNLPRYAVDGGSTAYASQICKDLLDEYVASRTAQRKSRSVLSKALAARIADLPAEDLAALFGLVDEAQGGSPGVRFGEIDNDNFQVFRAGKEPTLSKALQALILEYQLDGGDEVKD